jgi:hypothetical protein
MPNMQTLDCASGPNPGGQFEAADASSVSSCCPNLRVLRLPTLAGDPAEVLAPLCSLTCLQRLHFSCEDLDDAAMQVLTQLTALTVLDTRATPFIAAAGLMPFTSLKQIKRLTTTVMVGPTYEQKTFAAVDVGRAG